MHNNTAMSNLDVPILLVMFNRPHLALQVFKRIRAVRPTTLYLTVDGPRPDRYEDDEKVLQCRAIESLVDWPCTVKTLYREENLGCKKAVSSAITWFFNQVEAGIILEDDCLPDLSFFDYCRVLLEKYADEPKVMHIGGANIYGSQKWSPESFFFSSIPHIWGWATWRRAWALYDVNMEDYPAFRKAGGINKSVTYAPSKTYWKFSFDNTYSGVIDTWDYQWVFTLWKNQGLSIIPNQNLISNTGFGDSATHTHDDSECANLPTVPIEVDGIIYPTELVLNSDAINYAFANFYRMPSKLQRKFNSLGRLISKHAKRILRL